MELFHDAEFWVALCIVAIVVGAARPGWRLIKATLDGRATRIRAQIDEARKLREDAQALLAEYQKKQREAMGEAEKIISQAKADALRLRDEAEKDLAHALERRKQQALDRIAQSEAQAVAEVRNTAVDVALAAAQMLIQQTLGPEQKQRLADAAIAELPQRLN